MKLRMLHRRAEQVLLSDLRPRQTAVPHKPKVGAAHLWAHKRSDIKPLIESTRCRLLLLRRFSAEKNRSIVLEQDEDVSACAGGANAPSPAVLHCRSDQRRHSRGSRRLVQPLRLRLTSFAYHSAPALQRHATASIGPEPARAVSDLALFCAAISRVTCRLPSISATRHIFLGSASLIPYTLAHVHPPRLLSSLALWNLDRIASADAEAGGVKMRRIARSSLGIVAGAALALAVSTAPAAHAQQAQQDEAPLSLAQAAGVRRLQEVLEVLNTGDYTTMRAYFEANSLPPAGPPGAPIPSERDYSWGMPQFSKALITYHDSHGLDLIRVTTVPDRGDIRNLVAGIVRNRLTGDEEYLAIRVEPQAPHRITGTPAIDPQVVATWGLQRVASLAVTEQERIEEIGSYLKRLADADIFSGAVVIARDGEPVFAQAYGYADRKNMIPNTLDTPFLLASMNKLFTSLAIGQLVEQGMLSYDDPLSKFLPDFPDAESAQKIRIKHLLSHTAGLGWDFGYVGRPSFDSPGRVRTVQDFIDMAERKPAAFEPGTRAAYSNIGFVLLGRILEIVTGQDYYDYMERYVFAPAGATSASFPLLPEDGVAVVPMAYPYENRLNEETLRVEIVNELGKDAGRGSPAGDAVASALDLLKLSNAMKAGRIVSLETLRLHSTPKPELTRTIYGYGFSTRARRADRPFVGHGGNSSGTCTDFGELTDTPYTIIVLSNLTISKCMQVTERILRVLRP
jgi:CubicO group peptidase (beta-lactamase class C family)